MGEDNSERQILSVLGTECFKEIIYLKGLKFDAFYEPTRILFHTTLSALASCRAELLILVGLSENATNYQQNMGPLAP